MDETEFRQWAAAIHRAFAALDSSSYYQVLGVGPADPQELIRRAFHRRATQLHPDRHRDTPEPARSEVYALFKRMTEAYRVLIDHDLRHSYDAGLPSGRLRLTDEVEASRPKSEDDELRTPAGRRHYRAAKDALAAGDVQGAELNLSLAMSHEPDSPLLAKLFADVRARRALRQTGRSG
ncbi:MAG: J domain-containing protein [Deltaproteobacteria bacterium]|nr:J domain-containing protein [Deltaproteobacteria bacterium]